MTLWKSEKPDGIFCVMVSWPEIPRKLSGQDKKVTKPISREPIVIETWLTPQNDSKTLFSGSMKANYNHTITRSAPKMHFSDFWEPDMVRF